uniref:Uncharacterized protein n=1 Tax=uncultured Alphaproteobacteria bacterium TaxID=91750 RepID=A0A6G8F2K8_9PROT|nr:hypothetical protein PlAlph_3890 [uncultured Alphaproteobacteria bacterium]
MLEAYALNNEIWIEPNDSRQEGIFLKITKIVRLYITAVNDWGQTYKIDRYFPVSGVLWAGLCQSTGRC